MVTPVFELDRVSYSYDAVAALADVSLSIEAGKRIALLGANGSGKSTLLRLLDGLYFADSGRVLFHGAVLEPEAFVEDEFAFDFRRRVGLVFQNPEVQLFNPTVFDEVAFAPLQLRWPKERIVERVSAVLDPEVLLLDEPTAGLDPRSESQIIDMLIAWGDGARTVITATHDLGLVEDIADHCVLLHEGKIAAEGEPALLLRDQQLLGRTNMIHAHRHRHATGVIHSHPHTHPHRHD